MILIDTNHLVDFILPPFDEGAEARHVKVRSLFSAVRQENRQGIRRVQSGPIASPFSESLLLRGDYGRVAVRSRPSTPDARFAGNHRARGEDYFPPEA